MLYWWQKQVVVSQTLLSEAAHTSEAVGVEEGVLQEDAGRTVEELIREVRELGQILDAQAQKLSKWGLEQNALIAALAEKGYVNKAEVMAKVYERLGLGSPEQRDECAARSAGTPEPSEDSPTAQPAKRSDGEQVALFPGCRPANPMERR